MTFEEAWAKKEAEGYQYGADALEQVRFGWELRESAGGMKPIEIVAGTLLEAGNRISKCRTVQEAVVEIGTMLKEAMAANERGAARAAAPRRFPPGLVCECAHSAEEHFANEPFACTHRACGCGSFRPRGGEDLYDGDTGTISVVGPKERG